MVNRHILSGWVAAVGVVAMWAMPICAQEAARPANGVAPANRLQLERGGLRVAQGKRPWGPEQATGAPDTQQAGDFVTAWASLDPDGGPEWLKVGFDRAVKIAQIRIRESYNPGAVTKVVAITADGKEEMVWEGRDPTKEAPSDFVVPVQRDVTADAVKIYLDSVRVPGWNEVDAVELVGADGTRQWASSASASSTYAERGSGPGPVGRVAPAPFGQFNGKQVVVHLDGEKLLTGTCTGFTGSLIMMEAPDGLTTFVVNVQKVIYIEVAP